MMHVCVIGGGVVGLMTAWRLLERGAHVTVVDRGEMGAEASFAAAGIVGPQAELNEGDPVLELALESRRLYPETAARLGVVYQQSSLVYLALDELQAMSLKKRCAWQRAIGLSAEWREDARALVPDAAPELPGAALLANEGVIAPRPLLDALKRAVIVHGGFLRPNAAVEEIQSIAGRVSGVALAGGETILADVVIMAAGAWASRIKGGDPAVPQNAIEPVRGVLLQLEWAPAPRLQRVVYWRGGYVVPRGGREVIVGASSEPAGFDKNIEPEAVDGITTRAFRAIPSLAQAREIDRFCGLRPFARRERPYISTSSISGLIYAMGHYRNGIMLAPATAQAIAAHLFDRRPLPVAFAI